MVDVNHITPYSIGAALGRGVGRVGGHDGADYATAARRFTEIKHGHRLVYDRRSLRLPCCTVRLRSGPVRPIKSAAQRRSDALHIARASGDVEPSRTGSIRQSSVMKQWWSIPHQIDGLDPRRESV